MYPRKIRVVSLLASATLAGLAGSVFGQYQILGSYSIGDTQSPTNPNIFGNTGTNADGVPYTDDTGPNGTGTPVTYNSTLFQSYASTQAVIPSGYIQSAGSPYAIGTSGFTVQVAAAGGHFSEFATSTTAFYYSPTTGFNYMGQYNSSTSNQYVDTGTTTNYSSGSPSATYTSTLSHFVTLSAENAVGQAVGSEGINSPDSTTNGIDGQHAFVFNIPTNTAAGLGLVGTSIGNSGASYAANFNYSNTSSAVVHSTYQYSLSDAVDNLGNASGNSSRYFAYGGDSLASSPGLSGSLGTSAWFYNGTSSVETGLYGTGYSYQKTFAPLAGLSDGGTGTFASNADKGVNNGYQVGTATAYVDTGDSVAHSVGADGWVSHNGGPATALGLYNAGITPTVDSSPLAYSYSYMTQLNNSTNTIAFTAINRSTNITALNANGVVGGTSTLYQAGSGSLSKGSDAWIYTPSGPSTGSYRQVGLLSNGFASGGTSSYVSSPSSNTPYTRSSTIAYINSAGASVGTSTQYVSSGAGGTGNLSTGTIAWYAPAGGAAMPIGVYDANHTSVSSLGYTTNSDSVSVVTDTGFVAGSASRYTPGTSTGIGSDAWVYDSNTGQTYILDPNPNSTAAFTSQISYLAPNGVAVGEYKLGSNSYFQAFAWSEYSGFIDLTANTSMTDPNLTELTDAISYNPLTGTIITTGQYVSGGSVQTPDGGVAFLNATIAVPEPASFSVVGVLAAVGLLRRRRLVH
jgi:hypothetical protein